MLFYVLLTVAVTWPFALHPFNTTIAPLGGDIDGSISKYEALKQGHQDPFFATNFPWIAWPVGPPNNVGVDRVSLFSTLFLWVGSSTMGAIFTHSLLSFLGFVLTAGVTFWLVRRITGSDLAGLVAGVIYGFWPTMYGMAISDMTYTQMWLYLLPVWAFWELLTKGYTHRRLIWGALSIVPAVFWTPYYMEHVLVVGGTCLMVTLYYLWRSRGWKLAIAAGAVTGFFWLAVLYVYRYVGLHSPAAMVPDRQVSDFYQQAAQPLMYVLPGDNSWGPHGNRLLVYLVPRAQFVNLYVGLSVLALVVVGLVLLIRNNHPVGRGAARQARMRKAAVLAGWVVVMCGLFSLPPTYHFGPLKIWLPGDVVAHTVPALRAGQRFVMPLMGALAVLAGMGSALLLARVPSRWRLVAALVIALAVMADLWALVPGSATTIATYPSLTALARMPQAPVAWFEKGSMLPAFPHTPCLLEHEYKKPLINDCALGRSPNLDTILQLPLCDEVTALQAIGVRYMVLSPDDKKTARCLAQRVSAEKTVATDDTYEVVTVPRLGATDAKRLERQFNLQ
jgi:hypothetical protein